MMKTLVLLMISGVSLTANADMVLKTRSEAHPDIVSVVTFSDAQVSTSAVPDGVFILADGAGHHALLQFRTPENSPEANFAAGMCYARAQGAVYGNYRVPGMFLYLDDAIGCDEVIGQFRVREWEIADGHVQKLAIDFMEHCRNFPATEYGNLRINSTIPIDTPFMDPVVESQGVLSFTTTGNGIGSLAPGGMANVPFDRSHLFASTNFLNGMSFEYSGPLPGAVGDGTWRFDLYMPARLEVTPGNYSVTTIIRENFTQPGINFDYNGSNATLITGDLHVTRAMYESLHHVPLEFTADFALNREGNPADRTIAHMDYQAIFHGGQVPDTIFDNGYEEGQFAPLPIRLAYPCTTP